MISNMMMQTTGKMFRASFMGVSRQGVFLIPGVLLMPPLIGILGIQIAQPLADAISFLYVWCCRSAFCESLTGRKR